MVVTAASPGSGTVAALTLRRRNSAPLSLTSLPIAPRFEANPVNLTVTLDGSRAATADIPVTGGTLSVTDAKGNKFTLTIPDKALASPETIRMTPVASAGGIPLSGNLVGAVQLEPEGLVLFQLATLTMEPRPCSSTDHVLLGSNS